MEFATAVTAGGSVKFLPAVLMSPFSLIFCVFFLLKLLKIGEIDGAKFLASKSGGVMFLTKSMSVYTVDMVYTCTAKKTRSSYIHPDLLIDPPTHQQHHLFRSQHSKTTLS